MALQRVVIGALDDPIVPYTYTDSLAKSLDAKMVTVAKGGHFMGSDGFTEFPLLLDELSILNREKMPNQAMQPTGGPRTASLSMTKTRPFQITLGSGAGG